MVQYYGKYTCTKQLMAHWVNYWTIGKCCTCLVESNLLRLSHPVYTANSLLLSTDVQQWLNKQHVCGLDDVQTLGTGIERKEENIHVLARLEL